ncbi:hypothetical protein PV342_12300 [Streptomyces sp. PA03-3a]|nr:hypothetical protein [Streptomyces sp. PA03-3a]
MTARPAFLELTAERRPQQGDFLRRLEAAEPVSRAETEGDTAVVTWRRVRGAYLVAAQDFANVVGGQILQVTVPFDDEPVVIDGSLAGRLLDIYAACGWDGVAAVEHSIREHVSVAHEDLSGGTVIAPWVAAWKFFRITRNAVGIVVAQCLVDLEARVALQVSSNLDDVLTKLDQLRDDLGITSKKLEIPPPPIVAFPSPHVIVVYRASNTDLEKTYHAAMLELVGHRDQLDNLVNSLTEAESALLGAKRMDDFHRVRLSKLPPRDSPKTQAAAKRVEQLKGLVAEAEAVLRTVQEQFVANAPALLLLLPVMQRQWEPPRMTQALGEILQEVKSSVQAHQPPSGPRWVSSLAGVGGGSDPIPPDVVARLNIPGEGFERHAVRQAAARFESEPEFVGLVVEPLWADLLDHRVPRTSFLYAVGTWYLVELGDHLMERAIDAQSRASLMKNLRTLAALVSLAMIWIPPASAAVSGAVLAVDLLLMAESLYGVAAGYAEAGTAIGLAGAVTGSGVEALSTAARYCAYRRDVLATLPVQLALELATIPLGIQSREVRRLLLLRGYYNDLQTIAAWDPRPDQR